ncbi:response regulator receiver protein [Alkalidesulfovibrio alkalitolerans DSM 16529]|jgi:DNA-binding NtrC family response regulator|uniref:Response regulator receiver protein n=1 Tax=Alkalidesulfovibrio alkalitolerans DSM 16529 TaxID=1121439 RepID=S7TH44_9BACT|nr:sigma-54 dependent transcriptional regulator [Alkalidesulfovibrio alkalitolerans]EPR36131.1 response regulator receiver protein [Alkalidesulfovibrio alkalitolerans DSM 16529]
MKRILLAAAPPDAARVVREAFGGEAQVTQVLDWPSLRDKAAQGAYDVILADVSCLGAAPGKLPGEYREALRALWAKNPQAEIIVLAPPAQVREAVGLVKAGAGNYLTYPLVKDELLYVLESLSLSRKVENELSYFRDEFVTGETRRVARMDSPAMQSVYEKVKLVAASGATVLLMGETGTGKGVVARLIHSLSERREGPFIGVHCGAIPDTLIESELFGHEKGAFTGAAKRRLGKFELAAGGTIFLDEIGTIGPAVQIKLLQVVQEKTFSRLGGEAELKADARLIAATNIDLRGLVERGDFRKDLYYRLNVFPIEIPPLRERPEDIATLAEHFLERLARTYLKDVQGYDPVVLDALTRYDWPGNVRELENLVERAFILETSHVLTPASFPAELFDRPHPAAAIPLDTSLPLAKARRMAVDNLEHAYLSELLRANRGAVGRTAKDAGVTERQLRNLMTRHGLRKEDFRAESGSEDSA